MGHTFAVCKSCKAINRIQSDKAKDAVCGKCHRPISFHGLVSEVNAEEFDRILKASDEPVVVDFWASWCGPCQVYGPEFEKASLENQQAVFLKVSTEREPGLSHRFGIRGIPCTIIFKDGREIKRQPGALSSQDVKNLLQTL